eukprot:g2809.t1
MSDVDMSGGGISHEQQGALKDMIMSDNMRLTKALEMYEQGDISMLKELMESGELSRKMSGLPPGLVGGMDMSDSDLQLLQDTFGASAVPGSSPPLLPPAMSPGNINDTPLGIDDEPARGLMMPPPPHGEEERDAGEG